MVCGNPLGHLGLYEMAALKADRFPKQAWEQRKVEVLRQNGC